MKDKAVKNIISDLVLKEEDIRERMKRLVDLAKPFFGIEETTGKILFNPYDFTISEKIFLLLAGKYFASQIGILEDYTMTIKDMSRELKVKRTSLPSALNRLIRNDGLVIKPEKNRYNVNLHKIEFGLEQLREKYDK